MKIAGKLSRKIHNFGFHKFSARFAEICNFRLGSHAVRSKSSFIKPVIGEQTSDGRRNDSSDRTVQPPFYS